ncbi:hypothetical protein [Priestia abyssalis]|uniref:hypothetical protein n=1 Tax=Priestia abyssalis TaxID=1221450 RepID=UPI001474A868|nr:hypothetical protein [Priestia abyssalis]
MKLFMLLLIDSVILSVIYLSRIKDLSIKSKFKLSRIMKKNSGLDDQIFCFSSGSASKEKSIPVLKNKRVQSIAQVGGRINERIKRNPSCHSHYKQCGKEL